MTLPEYGAFSYADACVELEKVYEPEGNRIRVKDQTEGFFLLLFDNLDKKVLADLETGLTVLDWGCGAGKGTSMLQEKFPNSKATGLDASKTAIKHCKEDYPTITFTDEKINCAYDMIINSNCLEHFSNPVDVILYHLDYTWKYYVILVPFEGATDNLICSHITRVTDETFPKKLGEFKLLQSKKVFGGPYKGCWYGDQLLQVYERSIDR